jgi:hypothetical protein
MTTTTRSIIAALVLSAAAFAQGPDGLAEGTRLAAHALTLEDECKWGEASDWFGKAVTAVKNSRSSRVDQSSVAGNLLATLEIRARDLKERVAEYRQVEQKTAKLLNANRVESADQLLRETAAPGCVVPLVEFEKQVASREALSRGLIRQGDEAVRQNERKAALQAFDRAAAEDVEAPGLTSGREAAQALPQGHALRKTVVTLLVVGALAAGGYYGYEYEQKHNQLALTSH